MCVKFQESISEVIEYDWNQNHRNMEGQTAAFTNIPLFPSSWGQKKKKKKRYLDTIHKIIKIVKIKKKSHSMNDN